MAGATQPTAGVVVRQRAKIGLLTLRKRIASRRSLSSMTVVLSRWNCSVSRSMPNLGQRGTEADEEEGQFQAGRQEEKEERDARPGPLGSSLWTKLLYVSQEVSRQRTASFSSAESDGH
mgnify:CR=1 FL=1|jgi:hypothetical protein